MFDTVQHSHGLAAARFVLAAAVLLCGAAADSAAQKLPKIPLNKIPGAQKLNSLPKNPKQAANRVQDAEVQDLMREALETDDPEEQARIYTKILLLDPNNSVAYNGRKDALARMEQQENQQAEASAAENAAIEQSLQSEMQRRDAFKKAEEAFLADDLDTADKQIAIAREAAPNDPDVQQLDGMIQERLDSRFRLRVILIVVAVCVVVFALVWAIIWVRRRDPYIEIMSGIERGRRHPFDGDLLRIGAVQEDGGEQNDMVIHDADRSISRFHCEVHRRGKRYFLIDLGSSNGTFLNGNELKPGKPFPLKRGQRAQLARSTTIRLGFERRAH